MDDMGKRNDSRLSGEVKALEESIKTKEESRHKIENPHGNPNNHEKRLFIFRHRNKTERS